MKLEEACQVLNIGTEAGQEEIRSAYLSKVKEFPPDRAAREFERVRDAYEMLGDPRQRIRSMLMAGNPAERLASLLDGRKSERKLTGPSPWLAVLQEKKD